MHFFNSSKFRKAIIPSLGGHGSSLSVAKFFDFLANDLKYDTNNIIKKETLEKLNVLATNISSKDSKSFFERFSKLLGRKKNIEFNYYDLFIWIAL